MGRGLGRIGYSIYILVALQSGSFQVGRDRYVIESTSSSSLTSRRRRRRRSPDDNPPDQATTHVVFREDYRIIDEYEPAGTTAAIPSPLFLISL